MKKLLLAFVLLASTQAARAVELKGGKITAADGVYLGLVADRFETDSVLNPFGLYGNKHNAKSIWNNFGKYGDEFNELSAFNPHASKPPKIVLPFKGGWYYLTVNPFLTPRVDPNTLRPAE